MAKSTDFVALTVHTPENIFLFWCPVSFATALVSTDMSPNSEEAIYDKEVFGV